MTSPRKNHNRAYYGNKTTGKAGKVNDDHLKNTIDDILNIVNGISDKCDDSPCLPCSPQPTPTPSYVYVQSINIIP